MKKKTKKPKLRTVEILQWKEVDPRTVKKGQIFRQHPASKNDLNANPSEMWIAERNAKKLPHEKGYSSIKSNPIEFVETAKLNVRI